MTIKLLSASLLLAASIPALAQSTTPPGTASTEPVVTPKNGQSPDQIGRDRYDCYVWAKQQSGFDPAQSSSAGTGPDLYRRAFTACMSGRGYALSYAAPPGGASSTAAAPIAPAPSRPFM